LKLGDAAIIVTECIKSWGKQQVAEGNATPITRSAAGANVKKVASLIHEGGIVRATERCAIVLMAAATGGVTSSGEWKPAMETETAIPDAG
jgi:hypothetical protein